ncbi:MAG: hypothetical protein OES24_23335, partial [Acidimicrobiia bacterium]|nr:hypothetical protein [Acidimicrobiia bacterium]
MSDEICFPNHQGVPFDDDPPTVDGYVEPEPAMLWVFGSQAANVDTGWIGSSRETFGDATAVGLSSPLVAFQGVKHKSDDFIYLSFVIRRDANFADEDRIVIVLHPDFGAGSLAKTGDERRIDIQPL